MITNAIVLGSLLLAVLYFFIWLMRREFREQIERPKYRFQDQLKKFDDQLNGQKKGRKRQ